MHEIIFHNVAGLINPGVSNVTRVKNTFSFAVVVAGNCDDPDKWQRSTKRATEPETRARIRTLMTENKLRHQNASPVKNLATTVGTVQRTGKMQWCIQTKNAHVATTKRSLATNVRLVVVHEKRNRANPRGLTCLYLLNICHRPLTNWLPCACAGRKSRKGHGDTRIRRTLPTILRHRLQMILISTGQTTFPKGKQRR